MENIFLNTDWHLYSKKHEPHHPYRSRLDLALLHDNIGKGMTGNDLWIYLGDLCDPEVANRDMIRRILETIPAHKVLVRGNRDTEEDQWYLDLGFDQVTEGLIIHNMLFTHKPQPVPMDWINIHGDLHFEQIAMDGTHINAFATNWNDACHPVLLDDLIHGAKIQKLKLPKFKSDKYQAQFHEDLETPSVTRFLDLTDAFQLYPMDEGISKLVGQGQVVWKTPAELKDWMHEHIEYDPEETSWKLRNPNEVLQDCKGNCHDQAYFAKRYLDLLGLDTHLIFLVEYAGPIVQNAGKTHTLVAYRDDHGKYYWFENAWEDESGINGPYNSLNALKQDAKKRWVKRPEYSKLYCGDAMPIDHYGMNLNDYVEWNLPDRLLGETTTLAEAILFPDVDTTKYFETDDNKYKEKAAKAEVDQDGNTAVTLDESDEAYGERVVAEQHQKLIEMVNSLEDSLAESTKITKKQSNQGGPYQLFDMSHGSQKNPLFEGVQASSIDPNHKQNGHINLSHLKRVDITKEYLAKHGKKGILKDASPCTSTCKAVAWELDGRPIVTVAVGYQDKEHNWIGNMEVDSEFRGYGLGTQALKYAVDKLEGDALAVFKANKLAIQIYKDHGFVLKRPDEFKNKDYVQMVLDEATNQTISFKKGPSGHGQVHFNEAIATTASLDRGQKEDVADRYGLRDVGNTHEQEDKLQAELDAYKRKKAPTKAQQAKKREQDRLRYLKKARRVRKRKSVLRRIKRAILPGVKNEAVDTVDNADTESREIAEIRQEDTFGGDRKRYFDNKRQYANASEADDGPVIIEAVNPVRFFDRINEADTDVPHRSPIFVVSIADGAGLRTMLIGFSSNLKPAYALSFTENGTHARVLSVDDGCALMTRKISCVIVLALGTDDQAKALRSRLDYYAQNRTKLKTEGPKDPAMMIAGLLGIGDLPESYPLGEMDADYDPADIDRQVKSVLGQKRIQERLEEGAIMNLHRSNPWQDQILEYQLGLMDEESFVAYLEKPKRIIRVDHSQINEPDYKEQNLEFKKRTKGNNYEANEIQHYHTIIGDAETI